MPRILYNQTHMKLKNQFVKQLREEYYFKYTPIFDCFLMYMGFLIAIGCDYLAEMNKWQMEDYKRAVEGHKTMWHRNRRAGKTLGLSNLAIFFSLLQFGYRANKGKVIWRAPATDQLEQAQSWLKMNPFCMWVSIKNDVGVFKSKIIDMACLSAGKAASKGASVLIEDEYRDVWKGLKMYDIAGRAEDMVAEGPNRTRRMISASTGCRLTYFHNQFLSGEWVYCRHTYKDCIDNNNVPWITEDYVKSKAKEHPEDPYFVDQEFLSMWVARGDTAFRNVYIVDMVARTVTHNEDVYDFGCHPFFPLEWEFPKATKAGVDFNDPDHYIVIGSVDDEAIYVNEEAIVTTIAELIPFGLKYRLEIESGPFAINMQNAQKCIAQGVRCIHMNWAAKVIAERFRISMDKMIIIDRARASYTLGNLEDATRDPNSRETKLKKSNVQHGLDAFMHMIHRIGSAYLDEDKADSRNDDSGSEYINRLVRQSRRHI